MPPNHNKIPCPNIRVTLGNLTSTPLLVVWKKESEGRNSLAHSPALNFVLCMEQKGGKSPPFLPVLPPGEKVRIWPVLGLLNPMTMAPPPASPDSEPGWCRQAHPGAPPQLSPQSEGPTYACPPAGTVTSCE